MPKPLPPVDVLVLGQGLAGSTLAWRLVELGLSVIVIDRGGVDEHGRPSASRVAAGLITPVTGKRLTLAEDFAIHRESARALYRHVEAETGHRLLEEKPAVRVLRDPSERRLLAQREHHAHAVRLSREELDAVGLPRDRMPHGSFIMPGAARLDVPTFLRVTADWLGERLVRSECDLRRELRVDGRGIRVERFGISASSLVLCVGHSAPPCRWLDGICFSPAKGEVMAIRSRALRSERVIHHGVWIAPEGNDTYRVGSTAEWYHLDSLPSEKGRRDLLARLADAGVTDAEVLDHQAAVRPATPERQPTYGFSQAEPRIGWFNGLGAKGVLWAPWHAEQMARQVLKVVRGAR